MSWHTIGRVAADQDLDVRLNDVTHEQRDNFPQYRDDIDKAKGAVKILAELFSNELPYEVTMRGVKTSDGVHAIEIQIVTTVM